VTTALPAASSLDLDSLWYLEGGLRRQRHL
jgi:hypothetical protein